MCGRHRIGRSVGGHIGWDYELVRRTISLGILLDESSEEVQNRASEQVQNRASEEVQNRASEEVQNTASEEV